ncbi:RNA-directed DNA polymerase, eukaryota [Tanacetum coccineum]
MELISAMDVNNLGLIYIFDQSLVRLLGNHGGILCTWDSSIFHKEHHIISDNFVALYGTWIPNQLKLLVISVYAPQSLSSKQMLWSYISSLIVRWNGECLVMGDFNEVRCKEERWGSTFNAHGANVFIPLSSLGLMMFVGRCLMANLLFSPSFCQWTSSDPIDLSCFREWISDFGAISNSVLSFRGTTKGNRVGSLNDLRAMLSVIDKELDSEESSSDDLEPVMEFLIRIANFRNEIRKLFGGCESVNGYFEHDHSAIVVILLLGPYSEDLKSKNRKSMEARHTDFNSARNLYWNRDWLFAYDFPLIGLSINVKKSQLLGIGISDSIVSEAAKSLGCSIMKIPFKYLGIRLCKMSMIKAGMDRF